MKQPESRFSYVRDIKLHYVDWGGGGPVVLLLHGDLRTSRSWDAVARYLCADYRVISLDARGHGDSDWPARGYRSTERVADLTAFCDDLGLRHVVGVGHSMGAIVMTQSADRRPDLFERLILLEPRVLVDERFHRRVSGRTSQPRRTWTDPGDLHRYLQDHEVAGRWRDDVVRDVVEHETWVRPDGSVDMKWTPDMFNWDEREGDYYDLKETFPRLGLPVLLVGSDGATDNLDGVEPLAERVPEMRMLRLSGTGHNMYMERPDAVARLIASFAGGGEVSEAP